MTKTDKNPKKRPSLCSVRGDYTIPDAVKKTFGLTKLLKTNASAWTDPQALMDAYFVNCLIWEESGEKYLNLLSDALYLFSQSTAETHKVRNYAKEVSKFLKEEHVIKKSNFYYKLKATEAEAQRQEVLATLQGAATGAALSNIGAEKLRKRAFDELLDNFYDTEEDPEEDPEQEVDEENQVEQDVTEPSFTIKKNALYYEIHKPSKKYFVSPQKPIIQEEDRAACSEFFDLRLSTDVSNSCSEQLEIEYKIHMQNMKMNVSLKTVLGQDYLNIMNQLFAIKTPSFSKAIFTLNYASDSLFIDFLKQSYNDLCICWNDPQDYSQGGERTFFSEVLIQQFKLFSKMTKLLQFKWVEKKLNNTDYSWLVKKDYVKKDVQLKLLDGIGIMKKKNINFIMLESSGVGQDVLVHTLEDTIKNLKHATDSLTSILCEYKDCNIKTAKNIVVLTGHVIGEKLTIIKYSPGDNRKWNAVETRSCVVPSTFERRKESIKLFELFAYIYLTLEQQEKVYDQLTDEKLGFESVKEEEMVRNSACFI